MPLFQKGQSGNKGGRPRRALSEILAARGQELKQRGTTVGVMEVSDQVFIADKVWQLATNGFVELNGETYKIRTLKEWLGVVKFLYEHIDGKPTQEVNGEIIVHVVRGELNDDDSTD
jgi:hypothetical protein